jgi:hypothetical protein
LFVFIDLGLPLFDDAPTIILGAAGAATLVRFDAATFASLASARLGFAGVATALAGAAALIPASLAK